MISLNNCLILSAILFILGVIGFAVRRNIIIMLMSVELMLNAVNLAFVAFSRFHNAVDGYIFVIFVMAVAAAEAAVGLAIIVALFRQGRIINADQANIMKW